MAIYKGNKKVVAVYKGSTPINKIYKGSTLVFQKSGGGGNTHLFEGTATGNFNLKINDNQSIPITPDASGKWFYDTDETITSLASAFLNQTAVTSVDLSNLYVSGIPTSGMFRGSSNITSIKFSNTKIIKPTNAIYMFYDCSSLVSLDVSSFDMSNVNNSFNMFKNCTSLSTIKCKQAFKDWCASHTTIGLTNYETINWEIVD